MKHAFHLLVVGRYGAGREYMGDSEGIQEISLVLS